MNTPPVFKNEREFTIFLKQELEQCQLIFSGYKVGDQTKYNTKKLISNITGVEIVKTKVKEGGKCDLKIYHDGLDLSYDHKLSNPLKIEVKMNETWKDALPQAVRYKRDSEQKYGKCDDGKLIEIGVTTPDLFFVGAFNPARCKKPVCDHSTCQQFDIKRIFWKIGVALLERKIHEHPNYYHQDKIQITVNEGDKIDVVKKESANERRGSS